MKDQGRLRRNLESGKGEWRSEPWTKNKWHREMPVRAKTNRARCIQQAHRVPSRMVREPKLKQTTESKLIRTHHKYIGLDAHKERNEVAVADSHTGKVRVYGSIPNDLHLLEKPVYKLRGQNVVLHFVCKAGPCEFVIARRLQQLGEDCIVVAPWRRETRSRRFERNQPMHHREQSSDDAHGL